MGPVIAVTARYEILAVIQFLHAKKLKAVEIHKQLIEIYGETCISVQHVRKWCREFSKGRTDIHDERWSGRPSISDKVVAKIERILFEDRRITIRELAAQVPEVSEKSIDTILTERLGHHIPEWTGGGLLCSGFSKLDYSSTKMCTKIWRLC